jgi:hypothetical protein
MVDACHVAPPLMDKRATASPEIASEPFTDGFEVSSFHVVEPVVDNPLVAATT